MYSYVVREDKGSVYHALIETLSQRTDWIRKTGDTVKANLIIAERNTIKVPFGRLGHDDGILQLVNCYRGSGRLSRKAALIDALTSWRERSGEDISSWLPETYIIRPKPKEEEQDPAGVVVKKRPFKVPRSDQREAFRSAYAGRRDANLGEVWIAKSTAGLKGEGILISSECEELLAFVDRQTQAHIIQKYIEDPLLLPGRRKFDIRCWVLLDHEYNIHLMEEGVLRTCAEPYQSHDLTNLVCHLTNHCIQEAHSKDFGKYEEGNEMFYPEFNRILEDHWQVNFRDKLLPQIEHIIRSCCLAVKEELSTEGLAYHSFQLFGFDFMVDSCLNMWLLEVNSAPACAEKLLPDLIAGLMTYAINPLFPPSQATEDDAGSRVFRKL
ncbi:tubulin--tyrosine ligase-like [Diadema antillarum]|uniref:tubulin--tyrosine ligase-like n=1 Tax=Diadema antillarum TaxID=105358 RepID=UPI003A889946